MTDLVTTIGLTDDENKIIETALPQKKHEVAVMDAISDVIVNPAYAVIVNANEIAAQDREGLLGYYEEVCTGLQETVFWIDSKPLPSKLKKYIKVFDSFESLSENLKYYLLQAQKTEKKKSEFSIKLADCIRILSEIRKKPGIRTQELMGKLEKSKRTVQRYITALQMAGEWIEYDYKLKGWRLWLGKSRLFDL